MINPRDFITTKEKKALTIDTFKIWEKGFMAGYISCMEDASVDNEIQDPVDDTEEKKKKKKDIENVNIIMEAFRVHNPSIIMHNAPQRKSAKNLLKVYGLSSTLEMIEIAFKIQGRQYAPVITSPMELFNKVVKLETFLSKNKI